MIKEKVNILEKKILFKSPVEYKIKFLHGSPVYYITTTHKNKETYKLLVLDTDNIEYFILETSDNYNKLYEIAWQFTSELIDAIHRIPLEERDKKIEQILKKQLKEYFEGKDG